MNRNERTTQLLKHIPFRFEEYRGQYEYEAKYMLRNMGYTAFFAPNKVTYAMSYRKEDSYLTTILEMKFHDANSNPEIVGEEQLPGRVNYYIGSKKEKWVEGAATFKKIRYENMYPGIDIEFFGNKGELEFNFILSEEADPTLIAFSLSGAKKYNIDGDGNLVIDSEAGALRFMKPYVYQECYESKVEVLCSYHIVDEKYVAFTFGEYKKNCKMNIDPVLVYSSYYGENLVEILKNIKINENKELCIMGNYYDINNGSIDGFVTKLSSDGQIELFTTIIGGVSDDDPNAIALDNKGNIYVTGTTSSNDFPITQGAFQETKGDLFDAFVIKLDSLGHYSYSTYLGGDNDDRGWGITVDEEGNAYITGETKSTNFPLQNPYLGYLGDKNGTYAFVSKINNTGSQLIYSTYLGGVDDGDPFNDNEVNDVGYGIAIDGTNHAYVTGYTQTIDFPLKNPYQSKQKGLRDAFITKFEADGSAIIYSTYLGGVLDDTGTAIVVETNGTAYVCGVTSSVNFPIKNPFQSVLKGSSDIFITKLRADGQELIYSTYLGGSGVEEQYSENIVPLSVDNQGNVYITGATNSVDFPLRYPIEDHLNGDYDAFITKLDASGNKLRYSTILGGSTDDTGTGIAVDNNGTVYVVGVTNSVDFPVVHAIQPNFSGYMKGFVAILRLETLSFELILDAPKTVNIGNQLVYTITVTNMGPDKSSGATLIDHIPENTRFLAASVGNGSYSYKEGVLEFSIGMLEVLESTVIYIMVSPIELQEVTNLISVESEGDTKTAYTTTLVIDDVSKMKESINILKAHLERNSLRLKYLLELDSERKETLTTGIVVRNEKTKSLVLILHNESSRAFEANISILNLDSADGLGRLWWSKKVILKENEVKNYFFALPPASYEFFAENIAEEVSILIGERSDEPNTPINQSNFIESNTFRLNNL
ncbi:DUF7948 domain-containing protein [Anaeromicropila herbilytica]|uniref:DUF11 domain-containing protein n=1 Tax=Anaeromicropila herbilytica TaxID=2785025 RepID=A0A7R7EK09_9FIRM|nr:SBBP repeat-containing protein [Anaeromicropila herbilytica]BCN30193.1 hypothetical protein bsdtb5_14880 [Anaeromicropila herbilytica]